MPPVAVAIAAIDLVAELLQRAGAIQSILKSENPTQDQLDALQAERHASEERRRKAVELATKGR